MSKRTLEITILGESYTLITDESETHLVQAARAVDEIMRVIKQVGITDQKKIAVLASLQLASKLIKVEKEHVEFLQEKEHFNDWIKRQNRILSDFS